MTEIAKYTANSVPKFLLAETMARFEHRKIAAKAPDDEPAISRAVRWTNRMLSPRHDKDTRRRIEGLAPNSRVIGSAARRNPGGRTGSSNSKDLIIPLIPACLKE